MRNLVYVSISLIVLTFLFSIKREDFKVIENYHQSQFFEYHKLIESQPESKEKVELDYVLGGVVPHHMPITIPLLIEFYSKLKNTREVETFIILGPDHVNRGKGKINVSKAVFVTPFAKMHPNLGIIEELEKSGFVVHDERSFEIEHSIDSQVLLISKFFPDALIVPLTFHSSTSSKNARKLGGILDEIVSDKVFLVASVDFSHYLPEDQAKPLDYLSLNVLSSLNSKFKGLVEADSTQALSTLIYFLEKRKADNYSDLRVFNTSDFSSNHDFTTGYISGFFGR